jgi:hypothetical protein
MLKNIGALIKNLVTFNTLFIYLFIYVIYRFYMKKKLKKKIGMDKNNYYNNIIILICKNILVL